MDLFAGRALCSPDGIGKGYRITLWRVISCVPSTDMHFVLYMHVERICLALYIGLAEVEQENLIKAGEK